MWYENYHISLVAIATCEIYIFIPLDEYKSRIYRKNLNIFYISYYDIYMLIVGFLDHVTVLIGIAVRGVATAGIINQPFHNYEELPKYGKSRCIWGVLGLG